MTALAFIGTVLLESGIVAHCVSVSMDIGRYALIIW